MVVIDDWNKRMDDKDIELGFYSWRDGYNNIVPHMMELRPSLYEASMRPSDVRHFTQNVTVGVPVINTDIDTGDMQRKLDCMTRSLDRMSRDIYMWCESH